jgi:oxygen-independent coproporphyrinogen III oxidase
MRTAGLYIHIPFCLRKCIYCDFCSYTGLEVLYPFYVAALLREAEARVEAWSDVSFDTVYIGGGTPTVLPHDTLIDLWRGLKSRLPIAADGLEATIEANPGTVDVVALTSLRVEGIERLSIGVQSLNDHELAILGRIHHAAEARQAVHMARAAGFSNVNLDLMFGLPDQQLDDWQRSLRQALLLTPEHLSLYCLTVEPETPLAAQITAGSMPAPDDDLAAEMYEWTQDVLCEAGYHHYELSNWARMTAKEQQGQDLIVPALACWHNIKYWRYEPYLGLGIAAHSFDGRRRWANLEDVAEYIARWGQDQDTVAFCEELNPEQQLGEAMMLGLRLIAGVSPHEIEARFGVSLMQVYGAEIETLVRQGLLIADARIRLTRRGRLLGNRVFAAFLR